MISTAASGVFAPFPSQRNSVAVPKRAAESLRARLHSKSCRSPFLIPRAPWRPDWNGRRWACSSCRSERWTPPASRSLLATLAPRPTLHDSTHLWRSCNATRLHHVLCTPDFSTCGPYTLHTSTCSVARSSRPAMSMCAGGCSPSQQPVTYGNPPSCRHAAPLRKSTHGFA